MQGASFVGWGVRQLDKIPRAKLLWIIGVILLNASIVYAVPTANDDAASVSEDGSVLIGVLANDVGATSIVSITSPQHGTATIDGDSVRYLPDPDYCGPDVFSYTASDGSNTDTAQVTITVICVNDAPVAEDSTVTTLPGVEIMFSLRAEDRDIDPLHPEEHPLVFTIREGPEHGTVTNGLAVVFYEAPHTAVADLVYTPDAGFTGTDRITYAVTDPTGATAMGQIDIDVGKPSHVGRFAGSWAGSFTVGIGAFSIDAFSNVLSAVYELDPLRLKATASWNKLSFSSFTINADVAVAGLATLRSTLAFDPSQLAFNYFRTTTTFDLFDLRVRHTFYLTIPQTNSYQQFFLRTSLAGVTITNTTKFMACPICFSENELRVRWSWEPCDLKVDTKLKTTAEDGFDSFSISLTEISLFRLPFLRIGLNLKTTFTTSNKELAPSFTCRTEWIDCIKLRCELDADDMLLDGVNIYGIEIRHNFLGGVDIRMATSFDETKNASLTGYSQYFESFIISGPLSSCCGAPGRWQIGTYYSCDATTLFDWGMTVAKVDMGLTDQFRFSFEAKFTDNPADTELTFGWRVLW